ncbi:MAG: amidohydrolase family protein [Psychroflexus sp.]|nr:amidohydrolase family protein [Psychroflexus sp.]
MKVLFKIQLILLFSTLSLSAQNTYLHCSKIFDSVSAEYKTGEFTIVVQDNKILEVFDGIVTPRDEESKIIDLKAKVVYPGFIDMHVHLDHETSPTRYLDKYQDNKSDQALKSVKFCERTLKAGFTTVRDVGGNGVNIALKNAIDRGDIIGPRVYTSGKILSSTGGHGDPTNGSNADYVGDPGPKYGVVNSVADARKAVRQRYKNGADLVKITATGGVLSQAKNSSNPQFSVEEIKAITETAADYGFHVAAHAHGDLGMQRAILGGVKTIEHGTKMSDQTMEMMKAQDVFLVPTIIAGKYVSEMAHVEGFYPEVIRPKALEIGPEIQNMFARAYKKNVPIAFGTDAGVFSHGENWKEFGYMIEAGMPVNKAIQAATLIPAKILNKENEIGQLKKGFMADIIALDEEPNKTNTNAFNKVTFVMKDGIVYKIK